MSSRGGFKRGAHSSPDRLARRLNEIEAHSIFKSIIGGKGVNIRTVNNKLVVELTENRSNPYPAKVARFRVKSEHDDYLICRAFSPAVGESGIEVEGTVDINIAKPYILRRTPFDGKTITYQSQEVSYSYTGSNRRTATSDDEEEAQVIVPEYFADDEILAVCGICGLTGQADIFWEDLNTAGRMWALTVEE